MKTRTILTAWIFVGISMFLLGFTRGASGGGVPDPLVPADGTQNITGDLNVSGAITVTSCVGCGAGGGSAGDSGNIQYSNGAGAFSATTDFSWNVASSYLNIPGAFYIDSTPMIDNVGSATCINAACSPALPTAYTTRGICIGNGSCQYADTTPTGNVAGYSVCIGDDSCAQTDATDSAVAYNLNSVCIGFNTCYGTTNAYACDGQTCVGKNACGGTSGNFGYGSSASGNTAIGYSSIDRLQSGDFNTAIGHLSLTNVTTGSRNVGVGDSVGTVLATGTNNFYGPGFAISAAASDEANKFAAFDDNCTTSTCAFRGDHSTNDLWLDYLTTVSEIDTATNTVVYPVTVKHVSSSSGAAGMGVGISMYADDGGSADQEIARLYSAYTDATGGSEDATFSIDLVTAGAFGAAELTLTSLGILTASGIDQGSGTLEIPNNATLPATCTIGQIFLDTDSNDCADTGSGDGAVCVCKATNTWALLTDI